jgi:dihydrofolate reductase
MRNLFWQINVSVDGFMEGPNHELDDTAQTADAQFESYASAMLRSIDAIVLGRVTYQLFVDYCPPRLGRMPRG